LTADCYGNLPCHATTATQIRAKLHLFAFVDLPCHARAVTRILSFALRHQRLRTQTQRSKFTCPWACRV